MIALVGFNMSVIIEENIIHSKRIVDGNYVISFNDGKVLTLRQSLYGNSFSFFSNLSKVYLGLVGDEIVSISNLENTKTVIINPRENDIYREEIDKVLYHKGFYLDECTITNVVYNSNGYIINVDETGEDKSFYILRCCQEASLFLNLSKVNKNLDLLFVDGRVIAILDCTSIRFGIIKDCLDQDNNVILNGNLDYVKKRYHNTDDQIEEIIYDNIVNNIEKVR
jgi:hypothetical protein